MRRREGSISHVSVPGPLRDQGLPPSSQTRWKHSSPANSTNAGRATHLPHQANVAICDATVDHAGDMTGVREVKGTSTSFVVTGQNHLPPLPRMRTPESSSVTRSQHFPV